MASDSRRSNFTYATQNKIFDACHGECFYCHKSLVLSHRHKNERGAWNADHLIPASKGGNNSVENGVAACWNCNSKKSDLSHAEFIEKYGGLLYRLDTKIRCHGFKKDGKRCSYSSSDSYNGLHYCKNHAPKTPGNPLELENSFGNLMIGSATGTTSSPCRANYFSPTTFEPPVEMLKNLEISSQASISQKHKSFTSSQDMESRPIKALPGIGEVIGRRLADAGYTMANQVYYQFISLNYDKDNFERWLRYFGANAKQANDCYQCIYDWYLHNCYN